jgi:hypothetical protein
LLGGKLGELEAVAGEIGERDHVIPLVVMAENDEPSSKPVLELPDAGAQLISGELGIPRWQGRLIEHLTSDARFVA